MVQKNGGFQSTLPIQGETASYDTQIEMLKSFQSTLPIQGETLSAMHLLWPGKISIHSPYTGRDVIAGELGGYIEISIHSPYTGRDKKIIHRKDSGRYFNPLSLYRERPQRRALQRRVFHISIHSPYTGRDISNHQKGLDISISIHSPYTGRDLRFQPFAACLNISIHSPYTGRDCGKRLFEVSRAEISIHSPYTGRDPMAELKTMTDELFQSTLPIQGETLLVNNDSVGGFISIHSPYTGRDSNFAHKTPNIQPISYAKRQTKELFPTPTQQIITSLALISSISRCESPCIFMCTSHSH